MQRAGLNGAWFLSYSCYICPYCAKAQSLPIVRPCLGACGHAPGEDDDVNCWNAIPYLVNRYKYYIQNLKKIGWKLSPWQCYRFFVQYGGRDVINYDNELKGIRSYVKSSVIYLWKIPNFKNIGWKLWPWQCARFFVQYGGRDVINYDNELKDKRSYVKSSVIYLWKISNFLLE